METQTATGLGKKSSWDILFQGNGRWKAAIVRRERVKVSPLHKRPYQRAHKDRKERNSCYNHSRFYIK